LAEGDTRLVIALDFDRPGDAAEMVRKTAGGADLFKVGSTLFTAHGPDAVRMVSEAGGEVFLDLKFHDIPHQVGGAVRSACALGVKMMTVHAAGGREMMRYASEGAREGAETSNLERPLIIGVTVLTSLGGGDDVVDTVLRRAGDAAEAGLDGVVCSAAEVRRIKREFGDRLLAVVPGIRLAEDRAEDQARVGSPRRAAADGADFVVVGRSITRADDPAAAMAGILKEVSDA
jgi:orotidine-5'-phosphate decarboxylase